MTNYLDYKNEFLCVLVEYEVLHGQTQTWVKEWYPVRPAENAEVATLLGRPLTEVDSNEGIYVDDEGNVFQLAEKGETSAIEVERYFAEREERNNGQPVVSPGEKEAPEEIKASARGKSKRVRLKTRRSDRAIRVGPFRDHASQHDGAEKQEKQSPALEPITFAQLNLRQKLAVVRRRLVYVQKRGYNPRFNYNYVTAADIAGAVGNILAELGVVVVPRLESISHEAARAQGRTEAEHVARVVMSYSFVDVDTAEEITVKTAGEGSDTGDKAPYKAMTGALKYALLQSFLLATGDDPEEERFIPTNHSAPPTHGERPERTITVDELRELRQLIDDTDTELERVLTYYKLTSLDEMTEGTYRRALDLLQRKRSKQVREDATHAQN
jgi:ERF superfamily